MLLAHVRGASLRDLSTTSLLVLVVAAATPSVSAAQSTSRISADAFWTLSSAGAGGSGPKLWATSGDAATNRMGRRYHGARVQVIGEGPSFGTLAAARKITKRSDAAGHPVSLPVPQDAGDVVAAETTGAVSSRGSEPGQEEAAAEVVGYWLHSPSSIGRGWPHSMLLFTGAMDVVVGIGISSFSVIVAVIIFLCFAATRSAIPKHAAADQRTSELTQTLASLQPQSLSIPVRSGTGLTSEEAARLLQVYGPNEIPERIVPWYVMLGAQFVGLMPFMLEVAAILSAATKDVLSFTFIVLMLLVNALIGFHEEHKAKQSLDALKAEMTATVPVLRDGNTVIRPVAELVPGDVVFLRGGNVVPADCEWLEGDTMLIDTAALTGEPLPVKVPRPAPAKDDPNGGRLLLSGCIVRQGEGHCQVLKTGVNTEIGHAAELVQEASGHQAGVFETTVMQVVQIVIGLTILNAIVVLFVTHHQRGLPFTQALISVLALVIGAVPIALPLVMQVTMAIGAAQMATQKAIVTHLTALQEIASMTVLCSDKTGTLTTADMRVIPSKISAREPYTKEEALLYAAVASNPANKEDPIDKAVLSSYHEYLGLEAETKLSGYKKHKFVGFNPTVKRTVAYCTHDAYGELKIAKGLLDKVLSTGDDGGDCWECANLDAIREDVKKKDHSFSVQGYKTVGVALAKHKETMNFVGIIPMLDPPRFDTSLTIYRIRQAGIEVKMITGDHLNIAIETSRLIGLGTGILPAKDLWPASPTRDETVISADGFAQVLPKDKREVILVLQGRGLIVGMTGDGVNDAPALAQAQIGIAVDGATEAARSAADIILTAPGLSVIFDAVVESRRIFSRLRSYVLYRLAATMQIVVVLSILIYCYDTALPPFYIILLALLNDVTMLPIASDSASPSPLPEIPSMFSILSAALAYGSLEVAQTMMLYTMIREQWPEDDEYRNAVVYLQISIAVELLIFSCRSSRFFLSHDALFGDCKPSRYLVAGVIGANMCVSILAGFGDKLQIVYKVNWKDICFIWMYDLGGLVIIDVLKCIDIHMGVGLLSGGATTGQLDVAMSLPEEVDASGRRGSLNESQRKPSLVEQAVAWLPGQDSRRPSQARRGSAGKSTLPFPQNLRNEAVRRSLGAA